MNAHNYILIGGGVASHRAAEEIRKADPVGIITIISDEPHRLYSRVMLPHVLHGKIPADKVFLIKPDWYAEHRVQVIQGTVTAINTQSREVTITQTTSDAHNVKTLPYSKLLIASGGAPRIPPFQSTVILPFRTLDDTVKIQSQLQALSVLPKHQRVVGVYGSGFIAAEFINIFLARDCRVHIFYRSKRFWGRQLDEQSSKLIESRLVEAGCTLHPNATDQTVQEYAPTLKCLGLGIGILPNVSFLQGTDIHIDQGIQVNEFQQTNIPDIFAAGDIAQIKNQKTQLQQVVGTWLNAEVQGRTAGKNMAVLAHEIAKAPSGLSAFNLVTSYATKILDINITLIGHVNPGHADTAHIQAITDPLTNQPAVTQKLFQGEKLIGASLVGTAHGRMEIQKQIAW